MCGSLLNEIKLKSQAHIPYIAIIAKKFFISNFTIATFYTIISYKLFSHIVDFVSSHNGACLAH